MARDLCRRARSIPPEARWDARACVAGILLAYEKHRAALEAGETAAWPASFRTGFCQPRRCHITCPCHSRDLPVMAAGRMRIRP